jgi:hypothetical protein
LDKNKRFAMYEKDSSELADLLKKEEEKELQGKQKEKSVSTKDSLELFRGNSHQPPPDGGQGGTGMRIGGK